MVAQGIAELDLAFKHIGDGFDSPVWMPGKAFGMEGRIVVSKIVKQQEGIRL